MINRLLATLDAAGLRLSADEVADVIWLAHYMGPAIASPTFVAKSRPIENDVTLAQEIPAGSETDVSSDIPAALMPDKDYGIGLTSHFPSTSQNTYTAIRVPAAPSLRHSLALARAIRPLRRLIPSHVAQILD